jgi:hypothetical protein
LTERSESPRIGFEALSALARWLGSRDERSPAASDFKWLIKPENQLVPGRFAAIANVCDKPNFIINSITRIAKVLTIPVPRSSCAGSCDQARRRLTTDAVWGFFEGAQN